MKTTETIDIISKAVTILATILAGAWAYYRFLKGRVFKPRLALAVMGRRLRIRSTEFVLSTIELSNVGLSNLEIKHATLRVCSLSGEAISNKASQPKLEWLGTYEVLRAHNWIEPGEVIKEQHLLILPVNHDFTISLDCKIVTGRVAFTAMAIIDRPDYDASTINRTEASVFEGKNNAMYK